MVYTTIKSILNEGILEDFMKRKGLKTASFIMAIMLVLSVLTFTGCTLSFDGSRDYITEEELKNYINNHMPDNVQVEGGDNYNININNSSDSINLIAASKALLSTVSVYCNFEKSSGKEYYTAGSGVIYKLDKEQGDAYIITNYHVVYDKESNTRNGISSDINVFLYGQETGAYAIPATYVGGSMNYDIAVLRVESSRVLAESNAMAARIVNSDNVSVLETAIAVGNPEMEGISATAGHVNVDSEYLTITGADGRTTVEMRVMRIDTPVNSGNSGGGLFNAEGDLIGIVNAKISHSSVDNIAYAIPSNIAKYVADNILYYCADGSNESVYRCIVGITVEAAESYTVYDTETGRVHKMESVAVKEITAGSASVGRLEKGDIINSITIDGATYKVTRLYNVVDSMLNARVGSMVSVNVIRDGKTIDVTLDITEATLKKSV